MAIIQDAISTAVRDHSAFAALVLALAVVFGRALYHLILHPLSRVPGPLPARVSSIFLHCICFLGVEGRVLRYYHLKYKTKVLRIAPNHVSVSDSGAIRDIYITNGGFQKDARYTNFNLGPVRSIFSSRDTEYRDTRAKAVAPLFAPVRLRSASERNGDIGSCVADFVDQLRNMKSTVGKVDMFDLCARLSIDVVTAYLVGKRYGGLSEHANLSSTARQKAKLSANHFFLAIVAFSRFSLLPNWLFRFLYRLNSRVNSNEEVTKSFIQLDQFIHEVMGEKADSSFTYQGKLLQAGISPQETGVQSQAVVFAGGDSTAVMLVTILFHLVQNEKMRARLLHEIRSATSNARVNGTMDGGKSKGTNAATMITDPQTLPFLRAVIKEGLRLGMANPTRLTREVPAKGLQVGKYFLPPGTIVGCAAYMLHHDPDVFPDPFVFRPERWLDDGQDEGLRRPDMEKCSFAFGAGLRACIGKNLAQQQLYEAVMAVVDSEVLEGARTCQERIEMYEWFNGDIKGHHLDIEWSGLKRK